MSMKVFAIVSLICLLSTIQCNELSIAMKAEAAKLAIGMPKSAAAFVNGLSGTGDLQSTSFKIGDLNSHLKNIHNLPASVIAKVKGIAFAKAINFQSFSLTLKPTKANLTEVVGAVRNNKGMIDFAYISVTAKGKLIQKYQQVTERWCHRVWLVGRKCHSKVVNKPRGITAAELNIVTQALRSTAYNVLLKKITGMPVSMFPPIKKSKFLAFVEDEETEVYAEMQQGFLSLPIEDLEQKSVEIAQKKPENFVLPAVLPAIAKIASTLGKSAGLIKSLTGVFKSSRSSEIKQYVKGKGFSYFNQHAQFQKATNMVGSYFPKFIEHLSRKVSLPANKLQMFKDALEDSMYTGENVWNCFDTIFSIGKGGETKFVSILTHHNEKTDKFHVIFQDINTTFKLAPDTLIISKKLSVMGGLWEDSKDVVKHVDRSLTQEDVKSALAFFQIVALKGFADEFGVKLSLPSDI